MDLAAVTPEHTTDYDGHPTPEQDIPDTRRGLAVAPGYRLLGFGDDTAVHSREADQRWSQTPPQHKERTMSSRSDYEVDVRILSGEGGFTAEDVQDIADNLPRGVTVSDSAEPDANCDEYLCCAADRRSFSLRLEQIHPEDIELLLIELSKTHPSWLLLVEEMIFEQTNMAGAGRWRWLLAAGRKFEDLRQVVFYDHEMLEHFKVTEVLADPRSELGSPPFSLDTVRGWISAEMDGNDLPERFSNIRLKTEGGAIWRPVIRIGFEECDPPEPGDSA